jgi:hypothetical protein
MAPTYRAASFSSKSTCEYFYTSVSSSEWQYKKCLKLKDKRLDQSSKSDLYMRWD